MTPRGGPWAAAGLCAAAALVPLNSTMIAVALLDIEEDLGVSEGAGTWLVAGYLVVMALAQPVGGRIGDALGHRRTFLIGLGAFLAASALAAAAPWFGVLVALRMCQALCGGLMTPSVVALLQDIVPARSRGRAFGWFGTVMGLGAAIGPVLGGGLVAAGGWRAIFLVNIPAGIVAVALALRSLPFDAPRCALRGSGFDVRGAAAFTGFVGAVVAALVLAPDGPALWVPATLVAAACLGLFVAAERRAPQPFVALDLFRRRPYVGATATILLHNLVMYALLLIVPVLAERELDLGPSGAGLLIGAMTGGMMVVSPIGGHLGDVLGRRAPVLMGAALAVLATAGLVVVAGDPGVGAVAVLVGVAGVGVGLAGASLQTTAAESVPRDMVGVANGVFMTSRYTGGIAATGVAGAVAASGAYRTGFVVLLVAAVASLATAAALSTRGRGGAPVPWTDTTRGVHRP
ncbi:MAG: MFS transporter [Thermoleophilia bacterium]